MAIDTLGNDGGGIDLDGAPTHIEYNVDSTVKYIEVQANGKTYRQSFTYDINGKCTDITGWNKQ